MNPSITSTGSTKSELPFQINRKELVNKKLRKISLICGILSSLLYVVMNILGGMRWQEYNSASQTFSELIAIDAPTRPLLVQLSIAYVVLVYAFAWGVR